jgi:predicted dehydrogenase
MLRFAIVGCGDVALRRYLPALAREREVVVTALVDPSREAAETAAAAIAGWSTEPAICTSLEELLASGAADAAVDLTPAPEHAGVNRALLDAGLDVYSEKPLAATLAEADQLIDAARRADVRFLCAPAVAVSPRTRWIADLVASGRFGPATLAVAQHADPGPAAWRAYTGDPTVFYADGVGPVFDHGIYRLQELTVLLGPVRRVQAMGAIAVPTRIVRGGPLAGRTIPVTTPDHVLINLEFEHGGLGQLLASFGTPETLAPWLELHFAHATLSFGGKSWDPDAPASLYVDDDSPLGVEGWIQGLDVPSDPFGVVETGVAHFVRHLRGEVDAILTPEHARHVLDVILKTYASIADGGSHLTETTFAWPLPA